PMIATMPRMRAPVVLAALLALSSTTACRGKGGDGSDTGSPGLLPSLGGGGPLQIEGVKDDKFEVKGNSSQYGDVSIFQGNYQVTINGFPKGTKWSALDKKGVSDSDIYSIIKIADMSERLGDVPADPDKQRDAKLDP